MSKIYIVKLPIQRNGIRYGIGEKIELTETEADLLKDSLVFAPVAAIPEIPFTDEVSDVVPSPQDESLPPSVEAETQEEKQTTAKKPRTRP